MVKCELIGSVRIVNGFKYHNNKKGANVVYCKCANKTCDAKMTCDDDNQIIKLNGLKVSDKTKEWIDEFVTKNHDHPGNVQ
jgi:hypothetical protein